MTKHQSYLEAPWYIKLRLLFTAPDIDVSDFRNRTVVHKTWTVGDTQYHLKTVKEKE